MDSSDQLLNVLTEDDCKKCVKTLLGNADFKILNYKLEPIGEVSGFMGAHLNLTVTIFHQNKKKHLKLFAKSVPQHESQRKFVDDMRMFVKEVNFYKMIIADLKLHAPSIQLPVPECYFTQPDVLVMENLVASGYVLPNRKEPLCFGDCCEVLEHLARLHVASVILEKKIGKPLDQVYELSERMFIRKEGHPSYDWIQSGYRCIKTLAKEVPKYRKFLEDEERVLKVWNTVWDITKPSSKYVNVICRGDLWLTNMLVHYNKNGKADGVKFVDFQLDKYCPAATDIAMFLHISTSRQVRDEHLQQLLRIYYNTFTEGVSRAGIELPEFPFEALKTSFEDVRNLGYVCAVLYLPMILMDEEELQDVVDVGSSDAFDNFLRQDRSSPALKAFNTDSKYRDRVLNAMDEFFSACE